MTTIFDFTIIESHTTTSATIYDITTTVVDDIKCTTDRSTIEEDVDVDNNCDHENNQVHIINVHIIKHLYYDNNVRPDCLIYIVSFNPFVFLFPASLSSYSIVGCLRR